MTTNKLLLRTVSTLVLIGCSFWWLYKASENVFLVVTFGIAAVATWEYGNAIKKRGISLNRCALLFHTGLFFTVIWLQRNGLEIGAFAGIVMIALTMVRLSIANQYRTCSVIVWYLIPLFWIACPIGSLNYFRFSKAIETASPLLLLLLMIVAGNDIFAYLGGKKFGRHVLALTISPQKTVEGAIFGIVGGFVGALVSPVFFDVLSNIFIADRASIQTMELLNSWKIIVIVLTVVPIAQFSDLVESKFKRYCRIKDSSNFIPGHGGLLDRCDSYLLAIPTYYFVLLCMGIPFFL